MLEPILIRGIQPGGQLTITTDVENYQGFADFIQGPWLLEQMEKQADHVCTRLVADYVVKIDVSHRPFRPVCDSGDVYFADSAILPTGAQARWFVLPLQQHREPPRLWQARHDRYRWWASRTTVQDPGRFLRYTADVPWLCG